MDPYSFPSPASCGDVDMVRRLIAAGEDVNAIDPNGATSLHLVISSKKGIDIISEIIRLLLEAGASVDARNHEGYTPLHVAVTNGHTQSVDQLIRAGADVNAEINSGGVTSLLLAVKSDKPDNNRSEVVRLLVEAGASLQHQDINGFSPLWRAVGLGKINMVRQLILFGANVNEANRTGKTVLLVATGSWRNDENVSKIIQMLLEAGALVDVSDRQGITPLHTAATLGKAKRVDQLIKAGADVNATDPLGNGTVLHSVISSKQTDEDRFEVIKVSLDARILLDCRNSLGYNALQYAIHLRRVKTVEQLILAGANTNNLPPIAHSKSCIHLAIESNIFDGSFTAILRILLNARADINARNCMQRTPLHYAVEKGNVRMVELLIGAGANVHAKDSDGFTPLSIPILSERFDNCRSKMISVLLGTGVSFENAIIRGTPLLHHAIARCSIETVEQLISAGFDVRAVGKNGDTCLHAALLNANLCKTNYSLLLRILLNSGAPLNERGNKGQTPLHNAVFRGYVKWVEKLIEVGADVDVEDELGQTSLHLAMELEETDKRSKVIRSLLRAGASVVTRDLSGMTPLHYALKSGESSTIDFKELVQSYTDRHPNFETSKDFESIGIYRDSDNYRFKAIRLMLMVDILQHKKFLSLHCALNIGDVALVEWIIREGADLNATTRHDETSLHLALRLNLEKTIRHQIVQLLLKASTSVNVIDKHGKSPLVYALVLNDEEIVQQLIAAGAGAKIITNGNTSCLHHAILNSASDPAELISILIRAGAPVDIRDKIKGRTPLHYAVHSGYDRTVEHLIEAGAKVDATDLEGNTCLLCIFHSPSLLQMNARHLHEEDDAFTSYQKIVRSLLKAGARPDARDENGKTPLVHAAYFGDPVIVEQLIDAGADAKIITNGNTSCLHHALLNSTTSDPSELTSILIKAGAPVDIRDKIKGRTPLHYAVRSGYDRTVDLLIEAGAKVDATDLEGNTCLLCVFHSPSFSQMNARHLDEEGDAFTSYQKIVRSLLKTGARPDARDEHGKTPLVHAAYFGDPVIVEQLIDAGADAKIITNGNISSLHHAILNSTSDPSELIFILIKAGAPVDIRDKIKGRTPLHYAVRSGYDRTVELLIEAGAKVDATDLEGNPCLLSIFHSPSFSQMNARHLHEEDDAFTSYQKIVRSLLKAGARPDARDENGETALVHAAYFRDPVIVEQLINAGADANAMTIEGCTVLVAVCQGRSRGPLSQSNFDVVFKNSVRRIMSLLMAAGAHVVHSGDENSPRHLKVHEMSQMARTLYQQCQNELQLMRDTCIRGTVTYYQILMRRREIIYYVRNEYIIEKFEQENVETLFPIFGRSLMKSYFATKARRDAMDQACIGLHHVLGFGNEMIYEQILSCLDDGDLCTLCKLPDFKCEEISPI